MDLDSLEEAIKIRFLFRVVYFFVLHVADKRFSRVKCSMDFFKSLRFVSDQTKVLGQ